MGGSNRPRIKEHLSFGRGARTCAGAPLARVEVRVLLEKFLEYASNIDLDESKHGPRGDRRLDFEPSFIVRCLSELHVKLGACDLAAAPQISGSALRKGQFDGLRSPQYAIVYRI